MWGMRCGKSSTWNIMAMQSWWACDSDVCGMLGVDGTGQGWVLCFFCVSGFVCVSVSVDFVYAHRYRMIVCSLVGWHAIRSACINRYWRVIVVVILSWFILLSHFSP